MKNIKLGLLAVGLLLASSCTSVYRGVKYVCDYYTVSMNTGFDHVNSVNEDSTNLVALGEADFKWLVVEDPDPNTTEPRQAVAVHPYQSWWGAFEGTQWISNNAVGDPTSGNKPGGYYEYMYCICLGKNEGAKTSEILLRSDNEAEVYFNGKLVGQSSSSSFNSRTPVTIGPLTDFKEGSNCLRVRVYNQGGSVFGGGGQTFANAQSSFGATRRAAADNDSPTGGTPHGFNLQGEIFVTRCCNDCKVKDESKI